VAPGTEVVVTEGNYLLVEQGPWAAVHELLDEVWAVEVDPALRTDRLVSRHVAFGKAPEHAAAWVESVDEGNAALVRATLGRADLVVRVA
jgi:pantothenate kinase